MTAPELFWHAENAPVLFATPPIAHLELAFFNAWWDAALGRPLETHVQDRRRHILPTADSDL